jgi:hypothetical protein
MYTSPVIAQNICTSVIIRSSSLSLYIRVSVKKVICLLGIVVYPTVVQKGKIMLPRSLVTIDYLVFSLSNGKTRPSLVWGLLALIIKCEPF